MKNRVKNIFKNAKKETEIILILNSEEPLIDNNFFYVTGLSQGIFESSCAILFPDGRIDLIIPELELEIAKKSNANIHIYKSQSEYYNILTKLVGSIKNLGLNLKLISFNEFLKLKEYLPKINFIDVSESFDQARMIKDEFEINFIKKACELADSAMNIIPNIIKEGLTEYELAAEIGYYMQKIGADKPAFEIISSFGKNTAEPHYTHGDKKIAKGDFILCDFGACYKKYNSDITRTFVFGKASNNQKEMYDTVLRAQNIGFENIREGVKAFEVHNAVESYINKTKFKNRFIHSTGHSLGLNIHDGGLRLGTNSKIILKENMVFTVEPGIYLSDIGGVRIEDNVLVKKNGIEILSKSPRELVEL